MLTLLQLFSSPTHVRVYPLSFAGRLLTTQVNRNNKSKWYVSYDLWPHKHYPVWFQGLAYLMTPSLAAQLPAIALDTKYMFTDDVYVGILVSQVKSPHVIINNMFGTHTEQTLNKFLGSFRSEGRIFYHVPSIKYFITWYHLDSSEISYDPVPVTRNAETKQISQVTTTKSSRKSSNATLVITLVFSLIVLSFLCCSCCYLCYCRDDECQFYSDF